MSHSVPTEKTNIPSSSALWAVIIFVGLIIAAINFVQAESKSEHGHGEHGAATEHAGSAEGHGHGTKEEHHAPTAEEHATTGAADTAHHEAPAADEAHH
jgi:hypothetical protein